MSVTLAEIGFSIRNQVKGFFSSDDERIDIEFIYKKVKDVRSLLIRELSNSRDPMDPALYQEICCLEVKCEEVVCNGIKSGVKQFYIELPFIENIRNAIAFLGTADRKIQFKERSYMGKLFGHAATWTGNTPYFTIVDDKAILGNLPTTGLKFLCLVAILEDPLNERCYLRDENEHYPIPSNMVHQLELIVIKQLMSVLQLPTDLKNNAVDSPKEDQRS